MSRKINVTLFVGLGLIHGFSDTLPTFRHFYPELPSYSLESLLKQFAIPVNRLHDAKQVRSKNVRLQNFEDFIID